ncbi:MAG TPA: AraC family transcriptional regulator [Limnochordia bacterium]|nr:AraC family transcriptional regulator [Limnochordia bacterium]
MDWIARLNQAGLHVAVADGVTAEVLHWAYQSELPDNQPHRHTYFEICLVGNHGTGRFFVEGEPQPLAPGALFVARPGVIHQIVNDAKPWLELYWVSVQLVTAQERPLRGLVRAFADSPLALTPDPDGRVGAIWRTLRAVSPELRDEAAAHLAAALFIACFEALAGGESPAPPEHAAAARHAEARLAVRYIHDNLAAPLRAEEIAQQVNLSKRHLGRLFLAFTGTSIHRYITKARLDRARHLLRTTQLTVEEIGAQVGYPEVHHFTRRFSQWVGCPPAAYRMKDVPIRQTPGTLL